MNIRLGNLSLEEMEKIAGVKFPGEFIEFMKDKRQENVSIPLKKNTWHCFYMPFELVLCGDGMAEVVKEHLVPLGGQFKNPLQVSISNVKE